MTDRREQIAFPHLRTTYYTGPRPERHIPTREQLQAAARGQAALEARGTQQPSTYHIGSSAGFHPEEDEEEILDEQWPSRLPTSSRRYQRMPNVQTGQGRANVVEHFHDTPLRAHRQPSLLPPTGHGHVYTDESEEVRTQRGSVSQARRTHPLVWLGVFLTLLILGWLGLNFVTSWFQGEQNDWTYGKQRHFEINAVVGHSDSATNPSHFTAENNNGAIIVIELPGGSVNKAKIYQIETVPNNAGNPPVKLSFQDMNGDGKPDMLVEIGDGSATLYVTLYNNGTEFVSKL